MSISKYAPVEIMEVVLMVMEAPFDEGTLGAAIVFWISKCVM